MLKVNLAPSPNPKPSHWTGDWVRHRMREAFEIEHRLPSGKRNGAGGWPFAVTHDFSDMVHWLDARQRVWDSWARARGAYPFEISRMEEALGWLPLLKEHDEERKAVAAWALMAARGKSLRLFLERRRMSRTTFYRRVEDGSGRIARELQRRAVHVR